MVQPYWNTTAGSLGIYPAQDWLYIQLSATSPASPTLYYNFLNGTLPDGVTLDPTTGVISGYPSPVGSQTTYSFTVRLIDGESNLADRGFTFDIYDRVGLKITTPTGTIVDTMDSEYVNYQLQYSAVSNTNLIFNVSSGELPPGLYLSPEGVISGWPEAPTALTTTIPTTLTSTFTISLTNNVARDSVTFSIIVRNQKLTKPANTRIPVILNSKPLVTPISSSDPYLPYYSPNNKLIDAVSGENYTFKVIGHDFDNNELVYQFSNMPPGLTGNANTGWVAGVPVVAPNTLSLYSFSVSVGKLSNVAISSKPETYSLLVNNGVVRDTIWQTPEYLGSIDNGTISQLEVKATSINTVQYIVTGGKLPSNIKLLTSGRLVGRIPFQPTTDLLKQGDSTRFTFTISAFNPSAPLDSVNRTFILDVNQVYENPYETVYLRAFPNVNSKRILNSLLSDNTLIPQSYLYRPDDTNFSKAYDVRIAHMFGVFASSNDQYIAAMKTNHYTKRLVLGPLRTAQANDASNNVIYEVVYCPVFDDQATVDGVSVPKTIFWKTEINLYDNTWVTSNSTDNTSETITSTSSSPTKVRAVYPNSLSNMREEVASVIPQYTNQSLLPAWMTSQQANGETLGYLPVWVLCYTLPGYSSSVVENINNNWPHSFNDIDFAVDRYVIDKTATFNWNTNLQNPTWTSLPSAFPAPTVLGANDIPVLFPQDSILPNK
jgi:hypothetical protein